MSPNSSVMHFKVFSNDFQPEAHNMSFFAILTRTREIMRQELGFLPGTKKVRVTRPRDTVCPGLSGKRRWLPHPATCRVAGADITGEATSFAEPAAAALAADRRAEQTSHPGASVP